MSNTKQAMSTTVNDVKEFIKLMDKYFELLDSMYNVDHTYAKASTDQNKALNLINEMKKGTQFGHYTKSNIAFTEIHKKCEKCYDVHKQKCL